ncbi:ClpX C4-type zinc finger protein [Labrys wisconsinensis]|uniref:ClpX-type ZB domain-containing protein n=1 Tax=Labrys wisconsinensis TaxID=425677 RepID=A0ABU0JDG8_9HYPH|nr:ClpX C4-type zinc finger protein [Labrys wisconsinensis]MDQ0471314.1 hypothetical protein [Labrys wisconsinensis]
MRDFRDAKAMAHALREALKAKAVETTHSECLELIAKAFGFDNWNILSARIDAAAREHSPVEQSSPAPRRTLHCSFCGKSQHDVRKLVAGPAVFICDECIELCNEFVEDPLGDEDLARLMQWDAETAGALSTEELAHYVERGRKGVERNRLTLQGTQRKLALRDGEVPADDDILALPRLAYLKTRTREELLALQQAAQFQLSRHEEALRLATAALGARKHEQR